MKRTIRLVAIPAIATLLLAACSTTNQETEPAPDQDQEQTQEQTEGEPSETDAEDTAAAAPDDEADPGEAGSGVGSYEQGTFTAQNETGATFTVQIPTDSPSDIEEYRQATGQEPVGYISIEIDNSSGTEDSSPSTVWLVDEEGNQLEYGSAAIVLGDWGPTMRDDGPEDVNDGYWYSLPNGTEISEDEYDDLNNQGTDLYNGYLESGAKPGATTSAIFIGPEVPETFVYVEVEEALMPYPAEPAN